MEYSTPLLLLITIVCASILRFMLGLLLQTTKSTKLPPGPKPYPIIGNILELGQNPHEAITKLSRIYGPIMSLKLGNIITIVISSPQIAKQVLHENGQVFSSRTIPHSIQVFDHHKYSMVWLTPSPPWRNLRRICATKVFSNQVLESSKAIRQQKVQQLLDFVRERSNKGEVVDIGEAVFTTVLSTISTFFFSLDLANSSSQKSQDFKNIIRGAMEEAGRPNIADFFPILRPLDPHGANGRMNIYLKKIWDIIHGIVDERMPLRASRTDSRDVLDSLLDSTEESGSQFTSKDMLHLFVDLFGAGTDTTASTIEWTMAELLHNPDKLEKARKELSQAMAEDGTLEEHQILKLPFLRAVVKETLRLHPPAPFLVPHKCDETVQICGFKVPKDAQIFVNVWAMGQDPTIWKNPKEFMPERFVESEIDYKGNHFELIPFGGGKRICPGLPLAHGMVHLVVASLVHNFEWKLADGLKPEHMNMDEEFGLTLKRAQPLRVQAFSLQSST